MLNSVSRIQDHSIAFFQTFQHLCLVVVAMSQFHLCERGAVSLDDERAMSQKQSPFRTVETLCDYIATVLQESELA